MPWTSADTPVAVRGSEWWCGVERDGLGRVLLARSRNKVRQSPAVRRRTGLVPKVRKNMQSAKEERRVLLTGMTAGGKGRERDLGLRIDRVLSTSRPQTRAAVAQKTVGIGGEANGLESAGSHAGTRELRHFTVDHTTAALSHTLLCSEAPLSRGSEGSWPKAGFCFGGELCLVRLWLDVPQYPKDPGRE